MPMSAGSKLRSHKPKTLFMQKERVIGLCLTDPTSRLDPPKNIRVKTNKQPSIFTYLSELY